MQNIHFSFNSIIAPDSGSSDPSTFGSGRAGIGIFIREDQDNEEARAMLSNMLGALQYQLDNDARVFVCRQPAQIPMNTLIKRYDIKILLLFGIEPSAMGIRFPLPLNAGVRHLGVVYLFTHSLAELLEEKARGGKALRGALWHVLKTIFTPSQP